MQLRGCSRGGNRIRNGASTSNGGHSEGVGGGCGLAELSGVVSGG